MHSSVPSHCSQQGTEALALPQPRWITRTSRPDREASPDSERSPSRSCHFLAGWLNPSSCLSPAGVSTRLQMAPLAWKTFTLSAWTWQISCQAFTSLSPVRRWHGGWVVSTVISQQQGSDACFLCPVFVSSHQSDKAETLNCLYICECLPMLTLSRAAAVSLVPWFLPKVVWDQFHRNINK